jgi:hypothetical protein
VVARAEEIPPGERKIVEVGGRSIGVFNIAGRYYALRNRCPHQGGPLCTGLQFGELRSERPVLISNSHPCQGQRMTSPGALYSYSPGRSERSAPNCRPAHSGPP